MKNTLTNSLLCFIFLLLQPSVYSQVTYNQTSSGDSIFVVKAELTLNWNPADSSFQPNFRKTHHYNFVFNGHKLSSSQVEFYNQASSQWEKDSKLSISLDKFGRDTLAITEEWESSSESWEFYEKESWNYQDVAGKMVTTYTKEFYNVQMQDWEPHSRKIDTSRSDGQYGGLITFNFDPSLSQWLPDRQYEEKFDATGKRSTSISYAFNPTSQRFDTTFLISFSYDSAGNMDKRLFYLFDSYEDELQLVHKTFYSWDAQMQLISSISEEFRNGQWQWEDKWEYDYDSMGNNTKAHRFFYSQMDSGWQNASIGRDSFDMNNNLLGTQYVSFTYSPDQPILVSSTDYTYNSSDFRLSELSFIYSQDTLNNIKSYGTKTEFTPLNVSSLEKPTSKLPQKWLQPNPILNEQMNFAFTPGKTYTLSLTDVLGREVLRKHANGPLQLSLSQVESGYYVLKVREGKRLTHVQKVQIRR